MKYVEYILLVMFFLVAFACNKNVKSSLAMAGENRDELESVLGHFRYGADPLRYKAAMFLIANMPQQYHFSGPAVDYFDSVYVKAGNESQNERTSFMNASLAGYDLARNSMEYDISSMKAEYLIKMIDQACDAWENSSWSKQYDDSVFLEYVLPYKLHNEPISDWRSMAEMEYSFLTDDVVLSRRGMQCNAKDARLAFCETRGSIGASNNTVVTMLPNKSRVTFLVRSERETRKRLILKYSSVARNLNLQVRVNGGNVHNVPLPSTSNLDSFTDRWLNLVLPFENGCNVVTLFAPSDTICIDYIQLGAIENFKRSDVQDFSTNYYSIENVKSGKYISYDTASVGRDGVVSLKPFCMQDSTLLLRMDYAGYPLWRMGYYKDNDADMCLQIEFGFPNTLSPDAPVSSDKYIRRPFQQWLFIPLGGDIYRIMNKHTGLFLDTRKELRTGRDTLVQNEYKETASQKWHLVMRDKNICADRFFRIGSSISEAMRVFDLTHQFEYYIYDSPFSTDPSLLFKTKSGKCADETSFTIYLCRYLGIPSAYDFTPHWGNRSSSHSWSVLIDEKGKSVPFYMGNFPGDTAHYFHSYLKPKVFRYRYSENKEILQDMHEETSVPKLFLDPHFTDVTDEYCKTTDVERSVPKELSQNRIAYICVFDNHAWVPVHYGRVVNGKVTFKSMGRGIAYMAGIYCNGIVIPFGNPFILKEDGKVMDIKADQKRTITMRLLRKYPFLGAQDYFNSRMDGGQFQGASKENFTDAVTLHRHKGITNGNWYSIPVKEGRAFGYLRYIGGRGLHCNINELEFYSPDSKKIEGKIIGTEGESWGTKEKVFDGDILTGFGGKTPDGNWVGLKLRVPSVVSRIRYIGRNDGNSIEIGDVYELYSWNTGGYWELLETRKAEKNELLFRNVPSGGLYILRDRTKGSEERIFTYERNRQIWW